MNPSSLQPLTVQVLAIPRHDRWQAYQRLQELSISCEYLTNGCLKVEVITPAAIAQLRSVVQQLTASRAELIRYLEQCWEQSH